jgi:lysosomal acid lipase/cholesteryl ester hydrolase
MLAKFLDHNPSGASSKSFAHYAQLINGGPDRSPIFRKFDYGVMGNWRKYGQAGAPDFDLGSIKVPINIIAEGKDPLGTTQNIQNFLPKLPKGSWTLDTIEGWEHTSCMYPLDPELIFRIFEKILD